MKSFIFLILGIGLCLAAVICIAGIIGVVGIVNGTSMHEMLEGYKLAIGVVAAAFLICGVFFLYKSHAASKK